MSKISIEDLQDVLTESGVEAQKQKKILELAQKAIEEEKQQKADSSVPKSKNEYGVVLYAPDLVGKEYTASIYQIKVGDDHSTVLRRVSEAVNSQNLTAKRKKTVIDTMGLAFQKLKRKFIKEKEINIKTKTPVRVLVSDNKLV